MKKDLRTSIFLRQAEQLEDPRTTSEVALMDNVRNEEMNKKSELADTAVGVNFIVVGWARRNFNEIA